MEFGELVYYSVDNECVVLQAKEQRYLGSTPRPRLKNGKYPANSSAKPIWLAKEKYEIYGTTGADP